MGLQLPITLTESNGYYTIVVPSSGFTSEIDVDIGGAGGGGGGGYYSDAGGPGSDGRRLVGKITVSPGDVITAYVGGGGGNGTLGTPYGNNGAGGGGGFGAQIGSGGGGTGQLYPVSLSYAWSQWMNAYAVWVNPDQVNPVGQWVTVTRSVYFPAGLYRFYAEADNLMNVYVDGNLLYSTPDDHTFDIYQNGVEPTGYLQISDGFHTMQFNVYNEGGPAGFAFQWQNEAIPNSVYWSTRTDLNGNNSYRYNFSGGRGGNTVGDGSDVYYPGAGGGGGATALFLNNNLIAVAGGGGGGGGEGAHGAGAGGGYGLGLTNDSGAGHGGDGSDGYDQAGTPGGGGGSPGGAAGAFIYYDDAPSDGAYAGYSNVFLPGQGDLTYTSGANTYIVPPNVNSILVKAYGAGGGGGGNDSQSGSAGYAGNYVEATLYVNPGDTIQFNVGLGGGPGATSVAGTGYGSGGIEPTGALGGGRGGNAGPVGVSGSGGGGGAATSIYVNGTLTLVAGGGGGGGGGGDHSGGQGQISGTSGSSYGGQGQDKADDGGGGGGGGGGYPYGGAGGSIAGGTKGGPGGGEDVGAFAGANGQNLVPSGGISSVGIAGNGGGAGGGAGGGGSIFIQPSGWQYLINTGSGGASNNPGANGYVTLTLNRLGSGYVKLNGNWVPVAENWIKVNGQWKIVTGAWSKSNGSWKLITGQSSISTPFTPA